MNIQQLFEEDTPSFSAKSSCAFTKILYKHSNIRKWSCLYKNVRFNSCFDLFSDIRKLLVTDFLFRYRRETEQWMPR